MILLSDAKGQSVSINPEFVTLVEEVKPEIRKHNPLFMCCVHIIADAGYTTKQLYFCLEVQEMHELLKQG